MKQMRLLFFASALLGISGCPTRNKYAQMPTVRITSPTTETYTNGIVRITAALDPDLELPIVLRRGGDIELETLVAPGYAFDWNTTGVPEGTYMVTAEVAFSNETTKSPPVMIVVDRQKPTVTLTPAPGAADVRLRSPIRAEFSEPVLLSSPASSTFSLSANGRIVPTTATLDPGGLSATIAIDDLTSFSLPASLAVSIGVPVVDRAGNALMAPSDWSWSVPEWIVLPAFGSNLPPVMALGPDRLPVIGFAQGGSMGVSAVAIARYDGSGWNRPPPASEYGVAAAAGFSVAVDSHNDVFVAWSDYGIGSRFINVRRWDGAKWNEPLPVLDAVAGSGTDAISPRMRIDRTDRLVVSWIENGGVFAARWTGSTWDSSWASPGLSTVTANELALDALGNPVIAWRLQDFDQGISAWSGQWITDSLPASSQPPAVAVDLTQLPMAAIASNQSIRLLRLANRQALDATDPLTVTLRDQNPQLILDPGGKPAVVWLQTTARKLGFARWTGSNWDTRAGAFDDGSLSLTETTSAQIVADSFGNVWIAWWESGLVNVRMTNY